MAYPENLRCLSIASETFNARNLGNEKETIRRDVCVAPSTLARNGVATVVDARWYMGRGRSASVVYCSVWIEGKPAKGGRISASGYGSAGGYGYCKRSAAFAAALDSAGIKLSQSVAGAGDGAMRGAMKAISRKLGYNRSEVI